MIGQFQYKPPLNKPLPTTGKYGKVSGGGISTSTGGTPRVAPKPVQKPMYSPMQLQNAVRNRLTGR